MGVDVMLTGESEAVLGIDAISGARATGAETGPRGAVLAAMDETAEGDRLPRDVGDISPPLKPFGERGDDGMDTGPSGEREMPFTPLAGMPSSIEGRRLFGLGWSGRKGVGARSTGNPRTVPMPML
jgi:hypothetical protein